jgi:hypothetical protein
MAVLLLIVVSAVSARVLPHRPQRLDERLRPEVLVRLPAPFGVLRIEHSPGTVAMGAVRRLDPLKIDGLVQDRRGNSVCVVSSDVLPRHPLAPASAPASA